MWEGDCEEWGVEGRVKSQGDFRSVEAGGHDGVEWQKNIGEIYKGKCVNSADLTTYNQVKIVIGVEISVVDIVVEGLVILQERPTWD